MYLSFKDKTAFFSKFRDKCPTATKTMAMFHWTWLNEAYNQDMYKIWKQEGCYPEVHRRLGYRLTITKVRGQILPIHCPLKEKMCWSATIKFSVNSSGGSQFKTAKCQDVEYVPFYSRGIHDTFFKDLAISAPCSLKRKLY